MQSFPNDESIDLLQMVGVKYVVIEQEWLDAASVSNLEKQRDELRFEFRDAETVIYRLAEGR